MALIVLSSTVSFLQSADPPDVAFEREDGRIRITIGGDFFATYEYQDTERNRIYFANVHAPGGVQVTVPQPLSPGDDDHGGYHPGIWISYGDLNGNDYWRKRDRQSHDRFIEAPKGGPGRGTFAVLNRYLEDKTGPTICHEEIRHTILVRPQGYLLLIDARYRSDSGDLVFGDQQEMGLGVRMNTPLNVDSNAGARMLDSEGRINEEQIWGRQADWCDYSGPLQGRWAGITLMAHPENFRRSRFHARDYGCLVANPFGREDFGQGDQSRVVVKRGESLSLRFGVFLHCTATKNDYDPKAAFAEYLAQSRDNP